MYPFRSLFVGIALTYVPFLVSSWSSSDVARAQAPIPADEELAAIRAAIAAAGAQWSAADNPILRMPLEARRALSASLDDRALAAPAQTTRAPALPAGPLPRRMDWRQHRGGNWVTPVRDQGGCGSCWAYGAVAAFESAFLIQQGMVDQVVDFAEQELVSCSNAGNCIGGFTDQALAYIVDHGVSDEGCFPYTSTDGACTDRCVDAAERSFHARGMSFVENTVDAIKRSLQYGPVTACFTIYQDFYAYAGGVYEHVWGDVTGAHTVLVIGYDDDQRAWIAKNQWGTGWGDQGYMKIRWGEADFGWCAYNVVRNEAPRIDFIGALQAVAGETLIATLPVGDPDGDDMSLELVGLDALPGATFDGETGTLVWTPPADFSGLAEVSLLATDDWNPPLTSDTTFAVSVCSAGCDDGNRCTDEVCPDGLCTSVPNAAPCAPDGNSCTRDTCSDGACHEPLDDGVGCDDDNDPCTVDLCQGGLCVHEALPDGSACADDENACTADICLAGRCTHAPVTNGAACAEDGNACTEDTCRNGHCVHDPVLDGSSCSGSGEVCNDYACFGGTCRADAVDDGTSCNDGYSCTVMDTCRAGRCRGEAPACDDGIGCTWETCFDEPGFVPGAPFEEATDGFVDTLLEGDDEVAGPIALGFGFPLGDATFDALWVSTNGLVSFDGPVADPVNRFLPGASAPAYVIAAVWDDLTCSPELGCQITYKREGATGRFMVRWQGVTVWGDLDTNLDVQLVIEASGAFEIRFLVLDRFDGSGATVGAQGRPGQGVRYLYGEPVLYAGLSIRHEPGNDFACRSWPEENTCLVEDVCVPRGSHLAADPCALCDPKRYVFGYSDGAGLGCDDGDPCTIGDRCGPQGCIGTPYTCDDGLACTVDVCDGQGGCYAEPLDGGACDDGSGCTLGDTCREGACVGTAEPDGTDCSDGKACTTDDVCSDGRCVGALPEACADELACTIDTCEDDASSTDGWVCEVALAERTCLIDGVCRVEKELEPGNDCRRCESRNAYTWTELDGQTRCDDGDACTYDDACSAGACGGVAYTCEDPSPCTSAMCDGTGGCDYGSREGACDDANPCTQGDTCEDGECVGAALSDGASCDDARVCTTGDTCMDGRCRGAAPAQCGDDLACTDDGCADGPRIEVIDGTPLDISAFGLDLGIDSYDVTYQHVPIGFEFPFYGDVFGHAWIDLRGALVLDDGGDHAPELFPGECLPRAGYGVSAIAAWLGDVTCVRSQNCTIRVHRLSAPAPERFFVQWTNARVSWDPSTSLTMQVELRADGVIRWHYIKAHGLEYFGAAGAGVEAPGGRGAGYGCRPRWVRAGLSLELDPDDAWHCERRPVDGACVIDGACVASNEAHPDNPCLACIDGVPGWSWRDAPCDDGDTCTAYDYCHGGACTGEAYTCETNECIIASTCDGMGGCSEEPGPVGEACGAAASCEGDRVVDRSACGEKGRCEALDDKPCSPWGCADGACRTSCRGDGDCAAEAFCDGALCKSRLDDGQACAADDQCASGHCSNGSCCGAGLCCRADADCQVVLGPACREPERCQSRVLAAQCGAGARCELGELVDDDSGCGPEVVAGCGYFKDRTCTGLATQPDIGCPSSCVGDDACDPDARCVAGVCRPVHDDGAACGSDADCQSGHCESGTCCREGDCCRDAADCPAELSGTAICDNPMRCQGARPVAHCSPRFVCESKLIDDDSACGATAIGECGSAGPACSGVVDQPFRLCDGADPEPADEAPDEGGGSDDGCASSNPPGLGLGVIALLVGWTRRRARHCVES